MKNLIAISAAALTAATASAGFTNTTDLATWTTQGSNTGTQFPQGPGYAVQSIYTDNLHNATYSGITGTVTGGHGLGVYTLAGAAGTNVFASGSLANTNVGGIGTTSTPFSMTFTFSAGGGPSPANFLGGVGFAFQVTPGQNMTVTVNYASGSASTGLFSAAGSTNLFVGVWTSGGNAVQSVQFAAGNANTTVTITDIYYGLVPAPGAVALVGVAGLIGSRRRRA